jgi:phosphomannomutase
VSSGEELHAAVHAWIEADPDDHDRLELVSLLANNDNEELDRRFSSPLHFGTAGLRGPLEAGPSGMNRLSVRKATQGVASWLHELGPEAAVRGVVVGRDARHGSEIFNREVVSVLLGAGIAVYEMPGPLPTPLVAFGVRELGASAGIMITASHNPPKDNGYKLYDANGAQIIPPVDSIVERYASVALAPELGETSSPLHHQLDEAIVERYLERMVSRFALSQPSDLAICYTPFHGVGGNTMAALLDAVGFTNVCRVAEQFIPDPDFPTLSFPNPEEPGALDVALACAKRHDCDLVLANDPDADRLGAAVRARDGSYRVLRGDEIGWLLAQALLRWGVDVSSVFATSIVSSSLLQRMAAAADIPFATTLTGFKWISRAGWERERTLAFGYEEALGYAVDDAVADKDGMSAGAALARFAEELRRENKSLLDEIDHLESHFGVHAVESLSVRVEGPSGHETITRAIDALLDNAPRELGGIAVNKVIDLSAGYDGLPPTDGVVLHLGTSGRVTVRPSGTEPKVKIYGEIVSDSCSLEDLPSLRANARANLANVLGSTRERLVELLPAVEAK